MKANGGGSTVNSSTVLSTVMYCTVIWCAVYVLYSDVLHSEGRNVHNALCCVLQAEAEHTQSRGDTFWGTHSVVCQGVASFWEATPWHTLWDCVPQIRLCLPRSANSTSPCHPRSAHSTHACAHVKAKCIHSQIVPSRPKRGPRSGGTARNLAPLSRSKRCST